jgi:pyruvate,water dikinase
VKLLSLFNKKRRKTQKVGLNEAFKRKYLYFQDLTNANYEVLEVISSLEEKLEGNEVFGTAFINSKVNQAVDNVFKIIKSINQISDNKYKCLYYVFEDIHNEIKEVLKKRIQFIANKNILFYREINKEMLDSVGGKNANLGEMKRLGLPVPHGFAISTYVYRNFLDYNNIFDAVKWELNRLNLNKPDELYKSSKKIKDIIIDSSLPPGVEKEIDQAYGSLSERIGYLPHVSLRSSAVHEDTRFSFAGQYLTLLNLAKSDIVEGYKKVIASLYSPAALFYTATRAIGLEDMAMSVGCVAMVSPKVSGIMYSKNPTGGDEIVINAVYGLGKYAVDGKVSADTYVVTKDLKQIEIAIGEKHLMLISDTQGEKEIETPEELRKKPCLEEDSIKALARYALTLEAHYKTPVDIEWAIDKEGNIFLLQCRPLMVEEFSRPKGIENLNSPVLIDSGTVACKGIAVGKACLVSKEEDLEEFPQGSVLIASQPSPTFVRIMDKARAIVTDFGSITGHMASIAREFRIPALLNAKDATKIIHSGQEISVDCFNAKVYEGIIPEFLGLETKRENFIKNTPTYGLLQEANQYIVPLNLTNPKANDFTPKNCRTLHDITRFCHEMAFVEMFGISDYIVERKRIEFRLDELLPINIFIIDLDGGIREGINKNKVRIPDITSVPFREFLKGLSCEEMRSWSEQKPLSLGGFMSVLSEQWFGAIDYTRKVGDKSYAIISREYLNLNSRVGYHYSNLDAYCTAIKENNHITFSFKGGAADDLRRARRAKLIGNILENLGFIVEITGDLILARTKKITKEECVSLLEQLGRLTAYTQQLDMLMDDEIHVDLFAQAFLEGNYDPKQIFKNLSQAHSARRVKNG